MKKLLSIIITLLLFLACAKDQKKDAAQNNADSLATKHEDIVASKKTSPTQDNISSPKFDTKLLYGTWTINNDGPHADFKLNEKSLYIVDSEDGGEHDYRISHDSLIVKYEDYNAVGIIKKSVKDTLVINWDNSADVIYFTWKG